MAGVEVGVGGSGVSVGGGGGSVLVGVGSGVLVGMAVFVGSGVSVALPPIPQETLNIGSIDINHKMDFVGIFLILLHFLHPGLQDGLGG